VTLQEIIAEEIGRAGPMRFSRYMELCLYHPELGFYSRPQERFGKAGDFYTASDIHAVFGRLLARQFSDMWRVLGSPSRLDLVELGPGRGLFGQDVLDWAEKRFPGFFASLHYIMVERSPALRRKIEDKLSRRIETGKLSVVTALDQLQISSGSSVVLFANEFFDALPVEIIANRGSLRIDLENGRLMERFAPPSAEELAYLDKYAVHPAPGERVEAGLLAQQTTRDLGECLRGCRAFFVVIDYGYTREELLAGRHRGTLRAFRQHTISASPYDAPGEQDITTDVNFTALLSAAEEVGLTTLGLVTQAQFLIGIGEANQFDDAFAECRLPQERAKLALQLKHLVTPAGMGERFQVAVLASDIEKDAAARLSGLRFARSSSTATLKAV